MAMQYYNDALWQSCGCEAARPAGYDAGVPRQKGQWWLALEVFKREGGVNI